MDSLRFSPLNWVMARCVECNGVLTRADSECYICGLPVSGVKKSFPRRKKEPKPLPPITPLSNLLFIASLALTLVSFLSSEKMSVPVSAALSLALLAARMIADRVAVKRELAMRPVTIPRLHY